MLRPRILPGRYSSTKAWATASPRSTQITRSPLIEPGAHHDGDELERARWDLNPRRRLRRPKGCPDYPTGPCRVISPAYNIFCRRCNRHPATRSTERMIREKCKCDPEPPLDTSRSCGRKIHK